MSFQRNVGNCGVFFFFFFLMWVLSVKREGCLELYICVSLKKGKSQTLKSNVKANVYCRLLHIGREIQIAFEFTLQT